MPNRSPGADSDHVRWARYAMQAHRYNEAIGDEPAKLLKRLLAEISPSPPPEAFIALWLNDVRRYLECCPQTVNGVLS
jgi:hypothetical protein